MSATVDTTIDVRQIAPHERHDLIFSTFMALQPGRALQLVNDHAPTPLRNQFQARLSGLFDWQAIEEGPEIWRVNITRVIKNSPCCGSCC